jgi:hypothetical protein
VTKLSTRLIWLAAAVVMCWNPELRAEGPKGLAGQKEEPKRADSPGEAMEYYIKKRAPEGSKTIPTERYVVAREQMRQMLQHSTAARITTNPRTGESFDSTGTPVPSLGSIDVNWSALGPGNIGGRTRAIVIHPTSTDTMWAAAVAGGVWKTTNGGTTWAPLTDLMANIAVNSLVIDPNNPNILYAGTGEGYFNVDAVRGAGIFKTTNGGTSWTQLANTNTSTFYYVNDIVVSKDNSLRMYAATKNGSNTGGVQRSLDGGATWTQVLSFPDIGGCLDLAIRTDTVGTDTVFASCGTFTGGVIYRNTNAGGAGSWDPVLAETGQGRTSLAIAPSAQNTIYALVSQSGLGGNYEDGLLGVYKSTTGGGALTWAATVTNASSNKLSTLLLSNPVYGMGSDPLCGLGSDSFYNQGWYDNVIAVDPLDPNRVWVGGIDLFRSDNGGTTFGIASYWWGSGPTYAHADQHAIVFHPGYNGSSNKTMFVGNDGGVFKTLDARGAVSTNQANGACDYSLSGMTFTDLNNSYAVTQFYHGVAYPGGTTYFGGAQDNGTNRGTDGGGLNGWTSIMGGDGGYVAVDPTNTNNLYAETQNFGFRKSTNGGASFTPSTTGVSGDFGFQFITPFVMDPTTPANLWTGGDFIWRTTTGAASWVRASTGPLSGDVSALAVAKTSSNTVLVGTDSGTIYRNTAALSANSGTVWSSTTPRSGWVSSVAFNPTNANIAYATYSSFGGTHVWKSTNGGASFTGLDGTGGNTIPDIPVHVIIVHPTDSNRLYVGTDLGVFTSADGGLNWAVENGGFANVVTEQLQVEGTKLFAFTHGRGAFRVALDSVVAPPAPSPISPTGAITSLNPTYSWGAVAGATSYQLVVYNVTAGNVIEFSQSVGNVTSYAPGGYNSGPSLDPNGTAYKWKVRVTTASGTSPYSADTHFGYVPFIPVHNNPAGLITDTTPLLDWNAVDNATGYQISVYDNTTMAYIYTNVLGNVLNFQIPAALNTTHGYKWRVRARNSFGYGLYTGFKTFGYAPAVPTLIGPSGAITDTTPTIDWNAAAGATSYQVAVYDLNTSTYPVSKVVTPHVYTLSLAEELDKSHKYRFKVRSKNAVGYSAYSPWMDFCYAADVPVQVGPSGLIADTTPTFSWNPAANATGYQVTVFDVTDNAIEFSATTGQFVYEYTPVTPLDNTHQYKWRVRALNTNCAPSAYSGYFDFGY